MSTKIGTSYKRYKEENPSFDAIVVGSGIGGLTVAALLAKHGNKKVLVLERHYTAGGYTHVFTRPGYEWDVGVHYIGDVHNPKTDVRVMFDDITDGKLKWAMTGDVYDTIIIGDKHYDFVTGTENFRNKMKEYFPKDAAAIDEYIKIVQATVRKGQTYFAEKALPPFLTKILGKRMRKPLLKMATRTVWDVMHEITDNEELISVLVGQFGDYGLPPKEASFAIHAMVANHYLEGAGYPEGGSARIAETIVEGIEQRGGTVLINAEVKEIVVKGKKATGVRMADGKVFSAPIIVNDAGAYNSLGRMLPEQWRKKINIDDKLKAYGRSPAHISLYIGMKHSDEELGLKKSNLWVYPDGNHDKNMGAFLGNPDGPLPVAYISFPSAKDPDWQNRYPGTSTIQIITVAPYELFSKWEDQPWMKRGDEYNAFKEKLSQRLLEQLFSQMPQLKDKIDYYELSTPLSTKHFCNYEKGEIYGLNHTPERFIDDSLRTWTPIKNYYITGQDICSAGVAGALFGGVITCSVLLKKLDLVGDLRKKVQ